MKKEIVLTEILLGIKDDVDYRATKNYLLEFPMIRPKGVETYISAADIYRRCGKEGKTVRKTVDCIISAVALENGLTLFHHDSDFEIIRDCAGLKTLEA